MGGWGEMQKRIIRTVPILFLNTDETEWIDYRVRRKKE